ncbi:heterokaryon incompatibility protein-domain-containing protein [Neurospora hispaniola]|uniref:Heterokaryon incompatibility protein-domain-containing protein n=1 Tax=Neurospora hispaniola TaxID=588809 RepID=A0AAJ0IEQ7_9PEZI|nr:heterokaryon incompatibility protein-domain-containing protein [Neurospora hispaniola]
MDDVSKPLDSQQSKRSEVDASGALAQVEDGSPAASAKKSAAAMSVQYCDDCMRIDFDKLERSREEMPILIANVETCPMCAFLHAALVRQGIKLSNEANIKLSRNPFGQGWNLVEVCSRDRWHPEWRCVSLQIASDLWRPRLVDYGFIAKWLDDCVKCHGDRCFNNRLDLGLVPGLQFIDCIARRIIQASEAVDKAYLTLSYVWGAPSGSTSGIVEDKDSVSTLPIRLPRVVEDSIRVVKELGFRYLWVDRYCIPQADKRAKHTQIQLMGTIYARSAITIIAAGGGDAEYGLPGVDARARNPQVRIDLESVGGNLRLPPSLMVYRLPQDDVQSSLWSTRGWTYQEALLSKRRLVFTDNQVFFECQHMLYEESLTASGPSSRQTVYSANFVFPTLAVFKKSYSVWERINEFLKRTLSFEHDALDAISGILNMYRTECSEHGGIAFLCGMPLFPKLSVHQSDDITPKRGESERQWHSSLYETSVLIEGLLWDGHWVEKPIGVPKAELSSTKLERPRRSEFPSWTWVGWKGTSRYALEVMSISESISKTSKCAIRAVYEECQTDMDWDKDAEQILEKSALGLNPRFLDIKGTCFDASLAWSETGDWEIDTGGWVYTKPLVFSSSLLGSRTFRIPPNTLEEGEGKVHELVALLLLYDWDTEPCLDVISRRTHSIDFLLVQPVEYSAGRWVYERVTCDKITWYVESRPDSPNYSLSQQLGAIFEERELRLR